MRNSISRESTVIMCSEKKVFIKNNIPFILYTFVLFPAIGILPFVIFYKKYMLIAWYGAYLLSLNWFSKTVTRIILGFTIYKKLDPDAPNFIAGSSYIRQRYAREIISDFYLVISTMEKIKKRIK